MYNRRHRFDGDHITNAPRLSLHPCLHACFVASITVPALFMRIGDTAVSASDTVPYTVVPFLCPSHQTHCGVTDAVAACSVTCWLVDGAVLEYHPL